MKNKIILLVCVFALASTALHAQLIDNQAKKKAISSSKADYAFNKKTHNFGKVSKDKEVTAKFTITNNHPSKDLELINVHPTCGCTVSEYTKEPIPPGKTGTIKATFTGLVKGSFKKGIVITTSFSRKTDVLFLTGVVE